MRCIKGIIFDLDDTLAPESAFAFSGFRAAARFISETTAQDSTMLYQRMKEIFDRGDRRHIFNHIVDEYGISGIFPDIGTLVNLYREHMPDSEYRLYPDAIEYLPRFSQRYKCALVTDGFFSAQQNKITVLGIGGLFSPVIINHTRETFKPSPHSYATVLAQWNLEPEEVAAAGDNPAKDFLTPNRLGMLTLRIKRKGIYARLRGGREGKATVTVRNLKEMWEVLSGNRGLFPEEPNSTGKF